MRSSLSWVEQQMQAAPRLSLQGAEGNEREVSDGALCKGATHKMLSLTDALLCAEAQQSSTTQLFGVKGCPLIKGNACSSPACSAQPESPGAEPR